LLSNSRGAFRKLRHLSLASGYSGKEIADFSLPIADFGPQIANFMSGEKGVTKNAT
jgi:hypothetical protein